MKSYSLSRRDTSVLKGFAIFLILFHNFFHLVDPSFGENEFDFDGRRVHDFFGAIADEPAEVLSVLFSFLGHYGVQIFIMLSGIGLAYSFAKKPCGWADFAFRRIGKIYPILLTAVVAHVLLTLIIEQRWYTGEELTLIAHKLMFAHTLLPCEGVSICGPWWFFGLIVQLYIIFPILYRIIVRYGHWAVVAVCLVSWTWILVSKNCFDHIVDVQLMQNAPGHLPEFCIGIWFAARKDARIHWSLFAASVAALVLGNFYLAFYPTTFAAVAIICLYVFGLAKRGAWRPKLLVSAFGRLGAISMLVFAVHAILREPFWTIFNESGVMTNHISASLLFFAASVVLAKGTMFIYEFLGRVFDHISIPAGACRRIAGRVFAAVCIFIFVYNIAFYTVQRSNLSFSRNLDIAPAAESGYIGADTEFTRIALDTLADSYSALRIEGSVIVDDLPDTISAPHIIMELSELKWHKFILHWEDIDTTSRKLSFSYDFLQHLTSTTKGRTLKLYFWNNCHTTMSYKDLRLEVSY